jgi:hypothetical protein
LPIWSRGPKGFRSHVALCVCAFLCSPRRIASTKRTPSRRCFCQRRRRRSALFSRKFCCLHVACVSQRCRRANVRRSILRRRLAASLVFTSASASVTQIIAHHSRFEVDLNRPRDKVITLLSLRITPLGLLLLPSLDRCRSDRLVIVACIRPFLIAHQSFAVSSSWQAVYKVPDDAWGITVSINRSLPACSCRVALRVSARNGPSLKLCDCAKRAERVMFIRCGRTKPARLRTCSRARCYSTMRTMSFWRRRTKVRRPLPARYTPPVSEISAVCVPFLRPRLSFARLRESS